MRLLLLGDNLAIVQNSQIVVLKSDDFDSLNVIEVKIENVNDVKIINKTALEQKWTSSNFKVLRKLNNQICNNKFLDQDFFLAYELNGQIQEFWITKSPFEEETKDGAENEDSSKPEEFIPLTPENIFTDEKLDLSSVLKRFLHEEAVEVSVTSWKCESKIGYTATLISSNKENECLEFEILNKSAYLNRMKIELDFEATNETVEKFSSLSQEENVIMREES